MKLCSLFLIAVVCASLTCCGPRKPAYGNVNTNTAAGDENSNQQAGPSGGALSKVEEVARAAEGQAANRPADQPPPPQQTKPKLPAFLDQASGQIKDIPSYPNARRLNIQYGPMEGMDTMLVVLETNDAIEKIASFYDKAVKSNGWIISGSTRDQDIYEWNLKKGDTNSGVIRAKKDELRKSIIVSLHRFEHPATAKQ